MPEGGLHVVFGTGQVGLALAGRLAGLGVEVRAVSRRRPAALADSVDWRAADATDLIVTPDLTATRAITVRASADQVWPWIAQLGQGRGGFYSYDFLENLAGCDIHSADRIIPGWQDIKIGDEVRLAPAVGLDVAALEPGRSLVLHGGVAMGTIPPPYDFTRAWVLHDEPDGTSRLLLRERYAYTRPWARFLVEPVEAVSFVMSQKMLRGIRDRANLEACEVVPGSRMPLTGTAA